MSERKIQVFLFGAAISLKTLEDAGLAKRAFAPACIMGFDLVIQPIANLVEAGDGIVYGILANFTHAELATLSAYHLSEITSADFFVEPVLVQTRGGKIVPAITHISTNLPPAHADEKYIDGIVKAASTYGFPKWYMERIEKFRPSKT